MSFTLFEVSWEVCNKVGGIYTVVSSKARKLCEHLGDDYVTLGPWLLERTHTLPFEEEAGFEAFVEACRARGVAVKVGRWSVPGRPRTILVGFSQFFSQKDAILSGLWERHGVDSLFGSWDYVEPAMFGHASAIAIETWWRLYVEPKGGKAVAQFHEWMTASGLLYLVGNLPEIGTVFTTHATMLGRSLSSTGLPPAAALGQRTPEQAAESIGVRSKHSMEGVAARQADVFTTVSQITADEAELLHRRAADPLLPNGLDLELLQDLSGGVPRAEVRKRLLQLASLVSGEDVSDAKLLAISGRYEFHNKGIDILMEALAKLGERDGPRVVLYVLVPAGNSGPSRDLRDRRDNPPKLPVPPIGFSTHQLFDPHSDPVQCHAHALGLDNRHGSRVKIVQVPIYLDGHDGLFDLQYEAVLRAMDFSCFPSFYEPWGYTPAESLGVGVPTITTDCAGFGLWARTQGLESKDGIDVLDRLGVTVDEARDELVRVIERHLCYPREHGGMAKACLAAAEKASWNHLVQHYHTAFERALERAATRRATSPSSTPRFQLPVRRQLPTAPSMPELLRFDVAATLPEELLGLERLANNLWWSWDNEAPGLFEELSPRGWRDSGHNPVQFLRRVYQRDLEEKVTDTGYRTRLQRVLDRFDRYLAASRQSVELASGAVVTRKNPIAYFCFEFGIHESLRIYSGGLGVLAGDHLKSASDLDMPLVAMGLFYRRGYVDQRLSATGEQHSADLDNDPRHLPIHQVLGADGLQVKVRVQLPHSVLTLALWRADVGRVPLYLLDSDLEENGEENRRITHRLYGSGQELRLLQEIALGHGGMRALDAIGIEPAVLHLNEGHAAFAALERVSLAMKRNDLTFHEARELVRASTAFTTHTPVPAGHDVFPEDLLRRYFSDVPQRIGLTWEPFLGLGQVPGSGEGFNMTYLAMSLASFVNGVAEKHEEVSRALLRPYWSGLLENELPVTHVTNGIHLASWTRPALATLFGVKGDVLNANHFAHAAANLDEQRFWEERAHAKRDLLVAAAHSLQQSFQARQDSPKVLARMLDGLRTDALVIGFARRFAPYKRATLLFKDPARLEALLSNEERPVLFLFSGKAHPADGHGKELVRQIAQASRSDNLVGKVIFLENYDIGLARKLVQGVDVWLNNPIRPLEASGTSGMKVAANGGLNLSVLDGWWIEGYDGQNGWAIGGPRVYADQELQDQLDNEHLMQLLEDEVVPSYFTRDNRGLPTAWMERVRNNLATLPKFFNTDRMVSEYAERAYGPLASSWRELGASRQSGARRLAARHERLRRAFESLSLRAARIGDLSRLKSGDTIEVEVDLHLGGLQPDEVLVELVLGHHSNGAGLANMSAVRLQPRGDDTDGVQTYTGRHTVELSGAYGYGIRARFPETSPFDLTLRNLVRWS